MDFPISDFEISASIFKSGRMEDFLETPADQDYEDLLDCAKLEDLEEISQRLRHGLLPDLDETKNAQKQIELDELDDARLEVISRRQNELAAEMDEIDTRLSQIRKMNLQQRDAGRGENTKNGVKGEEMVVRKEWRRKEKEFMEEAEHELHERQRGGGGGGGEGGGSRRENYGFWQKGDRARNGGRQFDKSGRLSRNEHFFRDRQNGQNIHSRLGPWMEKSSSTRHLPYKRSQVKAGEGKSGNEIIK